MVNGSSVLIPKRTGSAAGALDLHRHPLLLDALERVDELLEREPRRALGHPVGAVGEAVAGDGHEEHAVGGLHALDAHAGPLGAVVGVERGAAVDQRGRLQQRVAGDLLELAEQPRPLGGVADVVDGHRGAGGRARPLAALVGRPGVGGGGLLGGLLARRSSVAVSVAVAPAGAVVVASGASSEQADRPEASPRVRTAYRAREVVRMRFTLVGRTATRSGYTPGTADLGWAHDRPRASRRLPVLQDRGR